MGSTKVKGKRAAKTKQASAGGARKLPKQPPSREIVAELTAMRAALLDGSRNAARVHGLARMLADAIVRAHRHTPLTAQLAEHIVIFLFAHVTVADRARKSRDAIQRAGTAIMRSSLPDIVRGVAAFLDDFVKDGSPAGDEGIARALSAAAPRVDISSFVIRHEEALRKLAEQWDAKPHAKRESKYRVLARLLCSDGILVDEKTVKATIATARATARARA